MKLKEKTAPREITESRPPERHMGTAPAIILSILLGFLSADTKLGGNGAPLCTAAAAVLPAGGGIAAFAGTMGAFFLRDMISSRITEIISIPAVIITKAAISSVLGKKASPAALGWLSAAAYIICGVIAAFVYNITAALVMAVILRGIISGGAA